MEISPELEEAVKHTRTLWLHTETPVEFMEKVFASDPESFEDPEARLRVARFILQKCVKKEK